MKPEAVNPYIDRLLAAHPGWDSGVAACRDCGATVRQFGDGQADRCTAIPNAAVLALRVGLRSKNEELAGLTRHRETAQRMLAENQEQRLAVEAERRELLAGLKQLGAAIPLPLERLDDYLSEVEGWPVHDALVAQIAEATSKPSTSDSVEQDERTTSWGRNLHLQTKRIGDAEQSTLIGENWAASGTRVIKSVIDSGLNAASPDAVMRRLRTGG